MSASCEGGRVGMTPRVRGRGHGPTKTGVTRQPVEEKRGGAGRGEKPLMTAATYVGTASHSRARGTAQQSTAHSTQHQHTTHGSTMQLKHNSEHGTHQKDWRSAVHRPSSGGSAGCVMTPIRVFLVLAEVGSKSCGRVKSQARPAAVSRLPTVSGASLPADMETFSFARPRSSRSRQGLER